MSSDDPSQARLQTLLSTADDALQAGHFQRAAETLREASHLKPQDERVKSAWARLHSQAEGKVALELLRVYAGSKDDADGQRALQSLKQRQLTSEEASTAIAILLDTKDDLPLSDSLISILLSQQTEARKQVAVRLIHNATEVFDVLYVKGDDAFSAFASIPLDEKLWPSKDVQHTAQQDLFRLCIATLIDAGVDYPTRAMRVIARQLALIPDSVRSLVDDEVFDVTLSTLDIRNEQVLRSQAVMATSKLLEISGEQGEELFVRFVTGHVAKGTNDDAIVAFSAAAMVFPILPAIAAKLFMTDGFVQQLVPNLERNSEAAAQGKRKSNTLEQAALELLSAACVDKACREAINQYCTHWLRALAEEREGLNEALAALVLAKVIGDTADEDVTAKLADLVLQPDGESDQAIEGLAYTSLRPSVKEKIIGNEALLRSLVKALNDRPSVIFGCLTAFANLSVYRPARSEEQKKMAQLKAYANSAKPSPDDPLDDDSHVTARCKRLLDLNIVSSLVACCKQTTSPSNVALIVRILHALAKEQKSRPKMAQQGAVKLLLQIRDRIAKTDKSTSDAAMIERQAAHALARLLISVNPSHIFTASLPATSAVSAIVPLLSLPESDDGTRDLLPTFEALLALTNLASTPDPAPRELLLRLAWSTIENSLMLSSNDLVQRATAELVCNLTASPEGVAKFADGSKQAATRLQILLALADVEDLPTRRAAGGALAMLTEWDAAVTAILDRDNGVKRLLGMCEDDSEEMVHRGLVCLGNVVSAPHGVGERGTAMLRQVDGAEVVKNALNETKDTEILRAGINVLKKITV